MTNGSLLKVKALQIAPIGAFCHTFELHQAIIGLENENKFSVFLEGLFYTGFTIHGKNE